MSPLDSRVHEYLDGELAAEDLSADELAQAEAFERVVRAGARHLARATPDLAPRIMAALPPEEAPEPAWARAWAWFWQPRQISLPLRPAYGLVAAGLLLALGVWGIDTGTTVQQMPPVAVRPDAPASLYVQFRLESPSASDVRLAGSFTDWEPELELIETAPGVWSAFVPLEPGVYDYTFLIDGEQWVTDPYAPNVEDSFGGSNSRLFLPTPDRSL